MPWAAVGAALQIGSSAADAKGARDANRRAARDIQFNPWDVNTSGGSVKTYSNGPYGATTLDARLDPTSQGLSDMWGNSAAMWGGAQNPNNPLSLWGINQATSDMPGLFQGAQNGTYLDPAIYGNAAGQMGQAMGVTGGNALGLQNMGNMYGMGMGPGQQQAGAMFGAGMGLLNSSPMSYQDQANKQLDLLRQQAQPYEQRQTNSMMQKLFNMGQLGGSGGGLMMNDFAAGLGNADLNRQVQAQNFGNSLYSQDLQAALQRQGLGGQLMSQGMGGMFQGAGMGADMLNASTQNAGMYGNMANSLYGMGMNTADSTMNRAQQRMLNATNLFGLGNQTLSGNLQNSLAAGQGMLGMNQSLIPLMQMSGALGQNSMEAAIARGKYTTGTAGSTVSDLAGGIGGFLTGGGMSNLGGMFGGGVTGGGGGGMSGNPFG